MERWIRPFFERYSIAPTLPDLSLLEAIARAFSYLPYENVTKILKEAGSTSSAAKLRRPGEVLYDHLRWNTGGTCFSLCNTLQQILETIGFQSHIAMADMHYGANIHCAVIVTFPSSRYLLDPGYLLHQPILLPDAKMESTQRTAMNTVLIRREAAQVFALSTDEAGQRKFRYRLRAVPVTKDEFREHWLHSFALNSMEHIMLSRVDSSGRIYFRKNRLDLVSPEYRRKREFHSIDVVELSSVFRLPADLIRQAQYALTAR